MIKTIGINDFVLRQTKSDFDGTRITEKQLNEMAWCCNTSSTYQWKKGYAPFCFIIPLSNKWKIKFPFLKITKNNRQFLHSEYVTRRKGELPYLTRYFAGWSFFSGKPERKIAKKINVIVYSKQQLIKEKGQFSGADFDIISINAEMDFEVPMSPDTIIRNHLGIKYGGSGASINKAYYMKAVKFWSQWAQVK